VFTLAIWKLSTWKTSSPRSSKFFTLLAVSLILAACGSEDAPSQLQLEPQPEPQLEPEPEPQPEPEFIQSCQSLDVGAIGAGTKKISIPMQAGERLAIVRPPRGSLQFFDETLGELHYAPPQGRLPDSISYELLRRDNSVRARGRLSLRLDPLRIMPLGDSITQGVEVGSGDLDSPPIPARVGYRKALLERLMAAGQVIDFTGQAGQRAGAAAGILDADNAGYPGVTIEFINDKVVEVLGEQPSDVLLLHIGTNETPQDATGIEAILDTLDAWQTANHPLTVFVATLVIKRDPAQQAEVAAFNADLRQRIAARGDDNVVLVEQANAVSDAQIDPQDVGVHPNAAGYESMAEVWFNALNGSDLWLDCVN